MSDAGPGTIAFTFPGQGSQQAAMGSAWTDHPSWELVGEASAATGRDVHRLLLDADAEELRETRNAQLATFVLSLVVLDAVERLGVEPTAVAGHSLGEYSALVAAGALSFEDGARLVAERGEAMQAAAGERAGTMRAVLGLPLDQVEVACARVDGDVWVANDNAPGQVVIAGAPEAIDAAADEARALGAKKVMPMAVGGAFHTPFMAPARDRLRKALDGVDLRDPEVPVHANVDALPHASGGEWPGLLAAGLCRPVRWRATLDGMAESGVSTFVEVGPGTVLTGLAKRTVTGARTRSVSVPADLDGLLEALAAPPGEAEPPGGEHLFAHVRLVVAPDHGVFRHSPPVPARVDPGVSVGRVGTGDVRSGFGGTFMGFLALDGERVTARQPVAWLHVDEPAA